MIVKDAAGYSTSLDFLVGGQSFTTSTGGEGFLIRFSKVGNLRWQKIFSTGDANEELVERVATFDQYSYAIVASTVSSSKSFQLLKFAQDGTITHNEIVGNQNTYSHSYINCVNFVLMGENFVSMTFQADLNDFHSFKNLATGADEYMSGLESVDASELYLMTSVWLPNDMINSIAAWKTSLFLVRTNATDTSSTSKTQLGLRGDVHRNPTVYDLDWDAYNYKVWGAVQVADDDATRDLFIMYTEVQTGDMPLDANMKTYSIFGLDSKPTFVSVVYADTETAFVSTMESSGKATIFKVSTSAGASIINKYMTGLDGLSSFVTFTSGAKLMMASSIVGAEHASLTESQLIVFASAQDLDFSSYNCYSVDDSDSVTITAETASVETFDWINVERLEASTSNGDNTKFTDGTFSLSDKYTLLADSGDVCTVQGITLTGVPDSLSYDIVEFTGTDSYTLSSSQCQGLTSFNYEFSVDNYQGDPAWATLSSETSIFTLDIDQVQKEDEGSQIVNITSSLSEGSGVSDSIIVTVGFYTVPQISPTASFVAPSTTLESDDTNCDTDKVYPLIFGDGESDLLVKDAAGFTTSRDVLLGGLSFTENPTGEGFLMRISKVGHLLWQKMFKNGATNHDLVQKVATFEQYSYAILKSTDGSVFEYFVLKVDQDGTVLKNEIIGSQAKFTIPEVDCVNFVLMGEHLLSATFRSDSMDFHAFKNLNDNVEDYMSGFETVDADELQLMSSVWLPNDFINSIAAWKTSLFLVRTNATDTTATCQTQLGLKGNVHRNPTVYDFDWDPYNYRVWGAVQTADDDTSRDLFIMYVEMRLSDLPDSSTMKSYSIDGLATKPVNVTVHYVDMNTVFISTMENDGTATIFKLANSAGEVLTNKYMTGFDSRAPFVIFTSDSKLMMVSSIIGAEDASLTKSQAIVLAASLDLDFTSYNCYSVDDTSATTITQETEPVFTEDWINVKKAESTRTNTVSTILGTISIPMAERYTLTDDNDAFCLVQPISVTGLDSLYEYNYEDVTRTHTTSFSGSQCQGLYITYQIEETGTEIIPDFISIDPSAESFTVDLDLTVSTDLGFSNINITAVLSSGFGPSTESLFDVYFYDPASVAPTSTFTQPSTTLETDTTTCASQTDLYPQVFGAGTYDMIVNDASGYTTSRDFLVGGQSFGSSTSGEGFLVRINKVGVYKWQRIFNTEDANEEKVEKVTTFNQFSYAIVSSLVSTTKTFYVVKLAQDGSVLKNEVVGNQATYTFTSVKCVSFIMMGENFASVTLDTNDGDFHSFKNLNTGVQEYMSGFLHENPSDLTLMTSIWIPNDQINTITAYQGGLYLLRINASDTTVTAQTQLGMDTGVHALPTVFDFDWDPYTYKVWGAVQVPDDEASRDLFIMYVEMRAGNLPDSATMKTYSILGLDNKPSQVNIHYVDSNTAFLSTLDTNGKANIFKISHSGGVQLTNKFLTGFDGSSPLILFDIESKLMMVSSMIGGESEELLSSQIAVFAASTELDFTAYTCFSVSDTDSITISPEATAVSSITWENLDRIEASLATGTDLDFIAFDFGRAAQYTFVKDNSDV